MVVAVQRGPQDEFIEAEAEPASPFVPPPFLFIGARRRGERRGANRSSGIGKIVGAEMRRHVPFRFGRRPIGIRRRHAPRC